jgi:hypothetical protein
MTTTTKVAFQAEPLAIYNIVDGTTRHKANALLLLKPRNSRARRCS